ncbi:hypothetical protein FRB91_007058 [Serendipita sp. 411]|nr:hypothetical protein FRB91_007058 [Serendipita sp. 411]
MSLESAMASNDTDGEPGSSNSPTSAPSTSDGSILTAPSYQSASNQGRYPTSLSAKGVEDTGTASQRLETFEELLAKAGYSQTRVVTPQSERLSKNGPTYSSTQAQDANGDISGDRSRILSAASDYTVIVANFFSWATGYTAKPSSLASLNSATGETSNPPVIFVSAQSSDQAESSQVAQPRASATTNGPRPDSKLASTSETDSASNLAPSPSSASTITPPASLTIGTEPGLRSRRATGKIRSGHRTDATAVISPRSSVNGPSLQQRGVDEAVQDPSTPSLPYRPPASHSKRSPLPDKWSQVSGNMPSGGAETFKREPNQVLFPGTEVGDSTGTNSPYQRSQRSHRSMHDPSTRRSKLQHETSQREGRRRRRLPSDFLLSRNGKPNSYHADILASPVTVLCRSSSVGPPTKSKRHALPLLTPSGGIPDWPLNSPAGDQASVPKIAIHSPSRLPSKQPLIRTASTSSAKYHSSTLSRRSSGYASLPRVGSGFTSISRSGTGTSAMASSTGLPLEVGSSSQSPVVPSYRDYFQNREDAVHDGETDEDSENEPRLANIIAPHVSPIATSRPRPRPKLDPVGRQQSIQSLRACLNRHHSASQTSSPAVATFPASITGPSEELVSPMQASSVSNGSYMITEQDALGKKTARSSKRSSLSSLYTGTSVRGGKRLFDEDFDHERGPRRVEGADQQEDGLSLNRGRRSTRSILNLGLGNLRWNSASAASNAHASTSSGYARVGSRHSSSSRMGRAQKRQPTEQELEQEKLLWGTSWGRRAGDQDRPRP